MQLACIAVPAVSEASFRCEDWVARTVSIEGRVEARFEGDGGWQSAVLDGIYCAGDELRTLENSRAAIQLRNETVVRLDQNSMVRFVPADAEVPILLRLFRGKAFFMSRFQRPLTIETPFVNAASGGTEYLIEVDEEQGTAVLTVIEGTMHLANDAGRLTVTDGESSLIRAGEAPAPQLTISARDTLEWALFYPPVLSLRDLRLEDETGWQAAVRASLAAWRAGDTRTAFDRIEEVPEGVDDPRFYAYRASLRLSVGRVEEARADIARAHELAPGNGLAVALQAIIAVVQNEPGLALELAFQASQTEPGSASVQIALSYAWQANVNLAEALAAAQTATRMDPESALAWARAAELWMAEGRLEEALDAAAHAETLNPDEARYQTVLGFAHLTRIELAQARRAFEKAIGLNSADPLPRLGLGLAKIRRGDLQGGRAEIEIAAVLDPYNPLIRSYLGKAYYEERRDGPSAIQLDLAKQFGPYDPTPYTYDAVRKQTVNRPVEAMHDIEQSIQLNDNRAPYRSRLLLDRDLAARSVSRGRIYEDLGFGQRALIEGWRSVNTDPMNYSAHRFLADSYAALPQSRIARQSALLTSQLLQPINHNPVQPSLSDGSVVSAGSGAVGAAFNEYTQLFDRDRVQLLASGIWGEQSTRGSELILSGVLDRYSWSLGRFRYETEGWRENADVDQRIYNAFVQASVTPNLSVQGEARANELRNGFLSQQFDPEIYSPTYDEDSTTHTYRIGARYVITPTSTVILSTIYQDHDERIEDDSPIDFPSGYAYATTGNQIARLSEVQYLVAVERMRFIAGGGHYTGQDEAGVGVFFDPLGLYFETELADRRRHTNLYLYSMTSLADELELILGGSVDWSRSETLGDGSRFNPKLGLIWDVTPATAVRLAAMRAMNRSIVGNQTVEPTQLAGFQQFYEDPPAARSEIYGLGLDHKFSVNAFVGAEFTSRNMIDPIPVIVEDDIERVLDALVRYRNGRTYFYWTPSARMAIAVEYFMARYRTDSTADAIPELRTHRVPVSVRFFDRRGFFAGITGSYVDQEGEIDDADLEDRQRISSRFWVWDGSIGYRLPKRRGIVSLGMENMFDRHFRVRGHSSSNEDGNQHLQLQPRRFVYARITLAIN